MNQVTDAFLMGKWRLDPSDLKSLEEFGETGLEFKPDGSLVFTWFVGKGRRQIAFLTYRLDGQWLITNQPSSPREDRVIAEISSKNGLVLDRDGFRSFYVRSD